MYHSRILNSKLHRLQERALRVVYNDKYSTFYQLLKKDKSVTEIFKFCDNATHNLRNGQVLEHKHNGSNNFGTKATQLYPPKFGCYPMNI